MRERNPSRLIEICFGIGGSPLRALANNPRLILADKPTGNLYSRTGQVIYALLKEIAAERTVLVVSHAEALAPLADKVLHIADGKLVSTAMAGPGGGSDSSSTHSNADSRWQKSASCWSSAATIDRAATTSIACRLRKSCSSRKRSKR